jgi:Protein of unknown function (DUF3574)
MRSLARVVFPIALSLASGCAPAPGPTTPNATLAGDAAHPARASGWVMTSLFFGLGSADGASGVSEAQWRSFLDREVTPRFPDGLSVFEVYGQWRDKGKASVERLRSKQLVVLYPDGAKPRVDIEAIRAAWKRETGDQSVLRVTLPADVSF